MVCRNWEPWSRKGFTIAEVVVAFALLSVAMLIVCQLGVHGLHDRISSESRSQALELAANILEEARAQPWDALTPEWAEAHRLPDSLVERLPRSNLAVTIAQEKDRPGAKRVTVEVSWSQRAGQTQSLQLVGLFSARSAAAPGEKP